MKKFNVKKLFVTQERPTRFTLRLPCAVVKNGKIILFGQKWGMDWAKHLSLRYVNK